jgi:hypothetical protein
MPDPRVPGGSVVRGYLTVEFSGPLTALEQVDGFRLEWNPGHV